MKAVSLFANIGVAEAYLEEIGINVVIANELIKRRADLYAKIYPHTKMICGDITHKTTFEHLIGKCVEEDINIVIATPPCQGMSTAGCQEDNDERNSLIIPVIELVKRVKPIYVFLENVPMILSTEIHYNGKKTLIPEVIENELGEEYKINTYRINTRDYSVPQNRERAIFLLTSLTQDTVWELPPKDLHIVTMKEAIGHLPPVDPYVRDISEEERDKLFPEFHIRKKEALKISKWHNPPHHIYRQVISMMHTPTGETAFKNKKYYPVKSCGQIVKGYHNTYKRQNWNSPAYTVTMDNRKISSQNNVHPGRYIGVDRDGDALYSDARALTLYELMIIMSLPKNWPLPPDTSEPFLRSIIGEGIPPLFVKKVFENIPRCLDEEA